MTMARRLPQRPTLTTSCWLSYSSRRQDRIVRTYVDGVLCNFEIIGIVVIGDDAELGGAWKSIICGRVMDGTVMDDVDHLRF